MNGLNFLGRKQEKQVAYNCDLFNMKNHSIKNKTSEQKTVDIKLLPDDFWLYSNPIILLMNFKVDKRAEAGQWTLEIQKMLRGIVESVIGLENIMNQASGTKRL